MQTPLYIPEHPLLIPSASYNMYRTHCTNRITNPGNSHRITFNTVKELSQSQQNKHFYTTDYNSNKEKVYKA